MNLLSRIEIYPLDAVSGRRTEREGMIGYMIEKKWVILCIPNGALATSAFRTMVEVGNPKNPLLF